MGPHEPKARACTIIGFRPLGTLSAEPSRFYTQIVRYVRTLNYVQTERVSRFDHDKRGLPNVFGVEIPVPFKGHCAWIARDIAEREARRLKRVRVMTEDDYNASKRAA